jgi:CheY-like chemotaxis protein
VELLKDAAVAAVLLQHDRESADIAAVEPTGYPEPHDSKHEADDAESLIDSQLPEPAPSPDPLLLPASPEPAAARPATLVTSPDSAAPYTADSSPAPVAASDSVSSPMVLDRASIAEAFAPSTLRSDSDPAAARAQGWSSNSSASFSSFPAQPASTASATSALPVYAASAHTPYRRLTPTTTSPPHASTPEERQRKASHGHQRNAGGTNAQDSRALRVLVVEDSAVNRKLLVMMCNSLGLRVQDAEDGLQAYQLIAAAMQSGSAADDSRCPFDVVLLDDCMPRMSGVECVQALRALGLSIPIFGITANALMEDQQRFLRAGATAVVTKPMQKRQLVDMIATARQYKDSKEREKRQQGQQKERQEADGHP